MMESRSQYGGKGNGLLLLTQNTDLGFEVPNFEIIDTSFYENVLTQRQLAEISALMMTRVTGQQHMGRVLRVPKRLEDKCSEISETFKGNKLAIRSSAVISEDTSKFSGAGIYSTFFVEPNELSSKSIEEAVLKVYNSVDSEKAIKYRRVAGLVEERMAVVVQMFIEPDWSGVIYTSNPSYPKDLSIEFVAGKNRVVDGTEDSVIVEYNKANLRRVFESEDLPSDLSFDINGLAKIGKALEERVGASDIEFVVKSGKFYFIQRREITDLQEPNRVKVPKYQPEQLLGVTKIKRGTGKITLPVVKLGDVNDVLDRMLPLRMLNPKMANEGVVDYFRNVVAKDKQFSEGYALLLPQFQATVMFSFKHWALQAGIKGEPTYDNLTPHKKAIMTTKYGGISSHAMTVSRERGVLYADFSHSKHQLDKVETGDVVSIYFLGRQAKVFLEESPPRSIHNTNPQVTFDITPMEKGYVSVRTSTFLDSTKPYTNDFILYLNTATGQEWRFKPFDGLLGGVFVNPEGKNILMHMAQMSGQYHQWGFGTPQYCKIMGYKPLTRKQLMPLIDGYVEHLKTK
jgi:phosphoenolpyruvate synthase/pyruvate phosphate dikinase